MFSPGDRCCGCPEIGSRCGAGFAREVASRPAGHPPSRGSRLAPPEKRGRIYQFGRSTGDARVPPRTSRSRRTPSRHAIFHRDTPRFRLPSRGARPSGGRIELVQSNDVLVACEARIPGRRRNAADVRAVPERARGAWTRRCERTSHWVRPEPWAPIAGRPGKEARDRTVSVPVKALGGLLGDELFPAVRHEIGDGRRVRLDPEQDVGEVVLWVDVVGGAVSACRPIS